MMCLPAFIKHCFGRYLCDTVGALAPLTAVMLPLLVGMVGVGVDVSSWMQNRRDMQAAADAAAIAAAWEISNSFDEDFAQESALKEAVNNGYENITGNSLLVTFGEDDDGNTTVTATLTSKETKYFSQTVFTSDVYATVAAATAVILPSGEFCMLSLAPTGTSMVFNGGVTINSPGCGLAVNSNDPNAALNVNGTSSTINVGDVSVVGGIDGEEQINSPNIDQGVSPFDDPYEDLSIASYNQCSKAQRQAGPLDADAMSDLSAADANGVRVICGGLLVKNGKTLNLDPGVYVVDGGDIDIKGTLTGTGVTLILTYGSGGGGKYGDMQISGTFNISAPLAGALDDDWDDYEGIAIYQDRSSPSQVQCNDVYGNGATSVSGTMYFPSRCLDIGGNSSTSSAGVCSRIIATTITMHGNPTIGNDCDTMPGAEIEGGSGGQVRLIL